MVTGTTFTMEAMAIMSTQFILKTLQQETGSLLPFAQPAAAVSLVLPAGDAGKIPKKKMNLSQSQNTKKSSLKSTSIILMMEKEMIENMILTMPRTQKASMLK